MKTAVVLGATGLVGSEIVAQLLESDACDRVVSIGRRPCGKKHLKLDEHVVDFDDEASYADRVKGDALFSALGTTMRKAGTKEAQHKIDVDIPLRVAKVARKNGVGTYALVSALGPSESSMVYYNRIKAELEREVQALGFPRVRIARPSILLGDRKEQRPMEALGATVSRSFKYLPGLKRYRPIEAAAVARALIASAEDPSDGVAILELGDLFRLAGPASG